MSHGPRPLGTPARLELATTDLGAAAEFYARLLGWTLDAEDTPAGRHVVAVTDAGPVGGMTASPQAQGGPPPAWSPFFGVADVAGTVDRACRLGATPLQPPTEVHGGSRLAVVADPAGALVGFVEPHGDPMAWGSSGAAAWVEMQSRDVEASARFYAEVLEWVPGPPSDGYRVFARGGEQVAGLMPMPPEVPDGVPSYWLVYFAVDDLDATCGRAGGLGGGLVVPPMTAGDMRFAVLEDPAGAVFAVLQAGP